MKVTYFGTTTLLFDDGVDQVLFDAHLTRPSLMEYLGAKLSTNEALVEKMIERHKIDRLRAIFVSHSHHDHVMDAHVFAKKCGAKVYGTESTLNVERGGGVAEEQLVLFDCDKPVEIGKYKVTVIPSIHSEAKWYNDDLGQTIDEPLVQPKKRKCYKEGGSFDFLIEHEGKKYLIRPSFNYLENQFEEMDIDTLFLGITNISKASAETQKAFFAETVEKLNPKLIVPLHWDNFFSPLEQPVTPLPPMFQDMAGSMYVMQVYCAEHDIPFVVQLPMTCMNI